MQSFRVLAAWIAVSSLAAPSLAGPAPAVGLHTRVAAGGNFEVAQVRRNGLHAPFRDFQLRGVGIGWSPVCTKPVSAQELLTSDFRSILDHVESAGANALRLYVPFPTSGPLVPLAQTFLDRCYEAGLFVVLTTPNWAPGQLATGGASSALSQTTAIVSTWSSHPAVLAFCLANEWTLNPSSGSPYAPADLITLTGELQTLANAVKSIDPGRVVMSSVHEHPDFKFLFNTDAAIPGLTWAQFITANAPSVGFWGVQLFRSHSLHPVFFHWSSQVGNSVAWCLTEFGADSFDTGLNASANATQAAEVARQWDECHRVTAGPFQLVPFAGSFVAFLADEWWKGPSGTECTHEASAFATTIDYVVPASFYAIRYRGDFDGFRSEEHLGLMTNSASGPLAPKVAFDVVSARFQNAALPHGGQPTTIVSNGYLTGGGLNNGFVQLLIDDNTVLHVCGGCPPPDGNSLIFVELDRSTGGVLSKSIINTFNATGAGAAVSFVNALPNGALYAIAVADTFFIPPFSASHGSLVAALQQKFGVVQLANSIPFRAGWGMIGVVGAAAPLAETGVAVTSPVSATAALELDLDRDGIGDPTDADLDADSISNVVEIDVGTDPVDPTPELYVVRLSRDDVTGLLLFEVRAGHPSANFGPAQLDYASFRMNVSSPVELDLTPFFLTLFTPVAAPHGGVAFRSVVAFPSSLDVRISVRVDETNGNVLIDQLHVP